VLDEDRFTGARRCDNQRPLALAQRRKKVHHARGEGLWDILLAPCHRRRGFP
jgi:hypothetical protein